MEHFVDDELTVCSTSPPELSSNPSLASILIPAHARNQAAASTPTNATAASGENVQLPPSLPPHPLPAAQAPALC